MAEGGDYPNPMSLIRHHEIQTETGPEGEANRYYTPSGTPEAPSLGNQHRLICPLCLNDVRRPKQLSECFHIFCARCLEKYIKDNMGDNQANSISSSDAVPLPVVCPTCSKKSVCPTDVCAWLQSDTYLHTFQGQVSVYSESGDIFCSSDHHEQPINSTHFCLECSKNFCGECHSNHCGDDGHKAHHTLLLYHTAAEMTVDMGRREVLSTAPDDDAAIQCPICRNTVLCEHLQTIKDLNELLKLKSDEGQDICPLHPNVPNDKKRLIGYCKDCEESICEKCKTFKHDNHEVLLIEEAKEEKLSFVKEIKKKMETRMDIFRDAASSTREAAKEFVNHVQKVQQEMLTRKGSVQTMIEGAFNLALKVIETTGQKQAELNRQIQEMQEEENFLAAVLALAEEAEKSDRAPLVVVRIWKGLEHIRESMGGESDKKSAKVAEAVVPQQIIEKRLVLPAPNCMTPDISILGKVGVENMRLQPPTCIINVNDNLLLFYSILPWTQTEALVSCLTEAHTNAVIEYNCSNRDPITLDLDADGEYCLVQVPGDGIITTFYHHAHGHNDREIKQIRFWDAEAGSTVKEMVMKGAGYKLKELTSTELPPRGIAVTQDNHLVVVCTMDGATGTEQQTRVILMTLKGDVLGNYEKRMPARNGIILPRYVTVNINGDVCMTDANNQIITVLSSKLREKVIIQNPYKGYGMEEKNKMFSPMGICHDSFGRLIVADSNNHAVLRIEIHDDYRYTSVPILQKGNYNAKDMDSPKLVALGPGSKLWVVCRSNIMVYYYMDTE